MIGLHNVFVTGPRCLCLRHAEGERWNSALHMSNAIFHAV